MGQEPEIPPSSPSPSWCVLAVAASAALGLALIADQAVRMSATYDEVAYLRVAARWWRTGEQGSISRMGSPLTFWKIQQVPTLWLLDRLGRSAWVDDPIKYQEQLLPFIRIGASWIWLVALLIASAWARLLHGPRGMAMAAVLFALSPNLLAHGALATMEMPLVACSSATLLAFYSFLKSKRSRDFWAAAGIAGLGMSCKFTSVLIPPILTLIWAIDLGLVTEGGAAAGRRWPWRLLAIARVVGLGMLGFMAAMVAADLVVTGFATIPLSGRSGHHPLIDSRFAGPLRDLVARAIEVPIPADWVGFAQQVYYQGDGGASYLWGETRKTGWRYYYLVTLAFKVPLAVWFLSIGRAMSTRQSRLRRDDREWMLPAFLAAFLLIAMIGSKRNYGFRYLLPMAVPAIVWNSGLAKGGRGSLRVAGLGVLGMAFAVGSIHPHELTYFNWVAGGPIGGRKILSDSNLDWGQGAKWLSRLQRDRPEFRDLTVFYFGDTDPGYYGVEGPKFVFDAVRVPDGLPERLKVETRFLAVSASLQWGPWGPAGYFQKLNEVTPIGYTNDSTIAIYRSSDLRKPTLKRF